MNQIKHKIYKEVLKEVSVNFVGAEDFINSKIRDMLQRKIFY